MSEHTKGPWEVGYDINTPNPGRNYNRKVVRKWHNTDREIIAGDVLFEANAHLIAAAPDILAALYEAEEYFDNRADADCDQDGFIPNEEMKLLTVVRDAIAKAEGRS